MLNVLYLVEAGGEALVVLALQEPVEQLLGDLGLPRLGGVLHGVGVQGVLLAQLHALLPSVVAWENRIG